MLAQSFFYLLWCALLSAALCVVGVALAYFADGEAVAADFLLTWVINFNGILVGATGWGLLFFVRIRGRAVLAQLNNILEIPPEQAPRILALHHRTTSWLWANLISVPATALGAFVLANCGFPFHGIVKVYLALCVISIYYVGSTILAFFLYSLAFFSHIEEQSQRGAVPRLRSKRAGTMDLEAIDSFFIISATLGIVAIYVGFRGSLTANFTSNPELFRAMLILPIFLFLPAALCYSFYPRYVLRKVRERDILIKLDELQAEAENERPASVKDSLELRRLILDLKEKMLAESRISPLLGLKDAPSLTVSLLLVLQLALQKDAVISDFLKSLAELR